MYTFTKEHSQTHTHTHTKKYTRAHAYASGNAIGLNEFVTDGQLVWSTIRGVSISWPDRQCLHLYVACGSLDEAIADWYRLMGACWAQLVVFPSSTNPIWITGKVAEVRWVLSFRAFGKVEISHHYSEMGNTMRPPLQSQSRIWD